MPHNSSRISLAIILCGFLYLFLAQPWSISYHYHPPRPVSNLRYNDNSENAAHNNNSSWCELEECAAGHWTPRQPPFTSFDQFREAYHNPIDRMWEGCRASSVGTDNLDPAEASRLADERLMKVMNWTWTPYVGQLRPWDAEDFVVRLLRSPGGLILIGDSLTRQHEHTIEYYLSQSSFNFDRNPPHLPMHNHKNVIQLLLKPNEPSTRRVLHLSGVPESRLKRPILTLLEDHMLIGQRDIRKITERLGAEMEYYWYHDFQRVPGWERYVAEAARPVAGEEEAVREDTVVLMNAGAHWSRHELSMLPNRPDRERQAGVKEAYRQMMKLVIERITPINNLTILYRTTSPGHPNCENHTEPYDNSIVAREAEKDITPRLKAGVVVGEDGSGKDEKEMRSRWDWDLFGMRNEMWRRVIESVMRERRWRRMRVVGGEKALGGSGGGGGGARWVYLDLWDMDLQRPDAHLEPGRDCLHWCRPSVLNEWTNRVYHTLKSLPRED